MKRTQVIKKLSHSCNVVVMILHLIFNSLFFESNSFLIPNIMCYFFEKIINFSFEELIWINYGCSKKPIQFLCLNIWEQSKKKKKTNEVSEIFVTRNIL